MGSLVVLLLSAGISVSQEAKPPIPKPAEREKTTKELRELYGAEYAKTGTEARRTLVQTLLEEARQSKDIHLRCVLLVEARDIAAKAGQVELAFEAVSRIVEQFDVRTAGPEWSAGAQKLAIIEAAQDKVSGKGERGTLARVCLDLAREALTAGRFETAEDAAKKAEGLARAARDSGKTREVKELKKDIELFQKEFKGLEAAELKLSVEPGDAEANLLVGRFYAFVKGDWDGGIRCLAKGSDEGLKKVAKMELAQPADSKAQVDVGNTWYDLAKKVSTAFIRERYQQRARLWYEVAQPGAKGLARLYVEKRLKTLPAGGSGGGSVKVKPRAAPGKPVDLLAMIDPNVHLLRGRIVRQSDGLMCTGDPSSFLIPYEPPQEYDLQYTVTPLGNSETHIGIIREGQRFMAVIDGMVTRNKTWLGAWKGGQPNETLRKGKYLVSGKTVVLKAEIRRDRVTVIAGAEKIIDFKGDFSNLAESKYIPIPKKGCLFVNNYNPIKFKSMMLIPVSGTGKRIK